MLADASSVVVALAEDYKNRVWEQRNGLSNDSVAGWNFRESSLAQARIQILTGDEGLLSAERTLSRAGTALGRAVRLDTGDVEELELAWQAYKAALENFVAESRRVVAK